MLLRKPMALISLEYLDVEAGKFQIHCEIFAPDGLPAGKLPPVNGQIDEAEGKEEPFVSLAKAAETLAKFAHGDKDLFQPISQEELVDYFLA